VTITGADFLLLVAAFGGATGVVAGTTAAGGCTTKLSTTVLTPAIWATSPVAMLRAVSLVTLPFRVTTPALTEA
jgi:hypothetical protein